MCALQRQLSMHTWWHLCRQPLNGAEVVADYIAEVAGQAATASSDPDMRKTLRTCVLSSFILVHFFVFVPAPTKALSTSRSVQWCMLRLR